MKKAILILCVLIAFSAQGLAYSITPTSPTPLATGDETNNNLVKLIVAATLDPFGVEFLYKMNVDGSEAGSLSGSYHTSFANTPADPSDATIYWDGPSFINDAFLVVKDGNHYPAWYLFDISDWNGTDTLFLRGFWPNGGAISHVELWGNSGSPVPEPATMLLLGVGLMGLAAFGRRKLI